MRIVHVTEATVGVAGGRESYVGRFCVRADAAGHENAVVGDEALAQLRPEEQRARLGDGLSGPPDVILLHTRKSWTLAPALHSFAPTLAYAHDYAFVCPASVAYFRFSRQACDLPPGLHCLANAYLKGCNSRRPDRNVANLRAVRTSIASSRHLHGILVGSQFVKDRMILAGVREDFIHVLPYFSPREGPAEVDYSGEDPNLILYLGRIAEPKGIDLLVEALALLPPERRLLIAGEGYYQVEVERLIQEKGLGDRVEFAPYFGFDDGAAKAEQAYRSAAVVVVPSVWPEPFGLVGLEAFSFGKPSVAFDVGGIREWLDDGTVGLLARPGDAHDLADKLGRLLDDTPYRRQLGRQGREHVRARFSFDAHWRRFLEICTSTGVTA